MATDLDPVPGCVFSVSYMLPQWDRCISAQCERGEESGRTDSCCSAQADVR